MLGMKVILGTMNFGPQVDLEGSKAMVRRFLAAGHRELDAAYVYNDGVTESMLGVIQAELEEGSFSLATKVHPRITGKLDGSAVTMQFEESLKRMNREGVDILYFHFPDRKTPIEGALETCARLYERGKIRELGLSNFPAWMVVDIWHLCKKHGWPVPSVYQGLYNGLSRSVESELFDVLRKFGMRFYAFNPLAGGMLTGKHTTFKDEPTPGRFARLASYRERYWKESYFEAVEHLTECCREAGIKPVEAAFRWLVHHSHLDASAGDGIIIGASSMVQFEQNLDAIQQDALPAHVLAAFDAAWQEAKPDSPEYFRFF
jgi:aflatoxin B1 aldehyde reductase